MSHSLAHLADSKLAHVVDSRLAESLTTIEARIDSRPFTIAAWAGAGAAMLGATAAALGAVAAGAGAYMAVRAAIKMTRDHRDHQHENFDGAIDLSEQID